MTFTELRVYPAASIMVYLAAGIMDNRYIKIAVILVFASFVIITLIFAVIVLVLRGPALLGK
jgi:hypothetical protein